MPRISEKQNPGLVFFIIQEDLAITPAKTTFQIKTLLCVFLCYQLFDEHTIKLHQVIAHDVRTFAEGVPLDQILSALVPFGPSVHNRKKIGTTLLMMLPQFGMICLMRSILPDSRLFQKKSKILTFQKSFPTLAYKLSGVSVVWGRQWFWNEDFLIGFWCCALESALAAIKYFSITE